MLNRECVTLSTLRDCSWRHRARQQLLVPHHGGPVCLSLSIAVSVPDGRALPAAASVDR
jgi:hypothetical protein